MPKAPTKIEATAARLSAAAAERTEITTSPIADNARSASTRQRFEHLSGVGVHVKPCKLVAAHCPDVGEGGRE
jgi:hypothetical protein